MTVQRMFFSARPNDIFGACPNDIFRRPYYDLMLPDNLEKFHVACTVLPDTRVATPQLHEELCTLPVEVSFYSQADDTCIEHVVLKINIALRGHCGLSSLCTRVYSAPVAESVLST